MKLILIRGLPGSGKSSLAEMVDVINLCEADSFFMKDGQYNFDPSLLPVAHQKCLERTEMFLMQSGECIVANTFTQRWEMEKYIKLADELQCKLIVIDLFDAGLTDEQLCCRNTHGVPLESIKKMRERYEHDWRNGNPLPPWERK